MTTRATRLFAGFGWLLAGLQLPGRKPGTLYLGAACVMLLSLLPSLISVPIQYYLPHTTTVTIGMLVFSCVCSLAFGPAQGGFLQVIDAVANDRPARARDVFAPYRDGAQAWPLVGFAAVMLAVGLVLVLGVFAIVGFNPFSAEMQVAAAAGRPALPAHFGAAMLGIVLLMPLLMSLFAIGYGQIALGGHGVVASTRDGVTGALRNLPGLWLLLLAGLVVGFVLALVMGVGVGVVYYVASMVAKPLGYAVVGAFYVALVLTLNIVLFGFAHAMWRAVCGAPGSDAAVDAVAA